MRCEDCQAWDRNDPAQEKVWLCQQTGNYTYHDSRTDRMCHLMPEAVAKAPNDWCMQFKARSGQDEVTK